MKDFQLSDLFCASKSEFKPGFHLQNDLDKEGLLNSARDDRSLTGSSLYDKRRIDSMFDETRSFISGYSQNREICGVNQTRPSSETAGSIVKPKITNSVQERIEKMFTEINMNEYISEDAQKFPVAYLGAIPLVNKVTSLLALQQPLKQLYFSYRKNIKSTKPLKGWLQITKSGLRIRQYRKHENSGALEQLNPFPTIAVWAAVKFVCKPKDFEPGKKYAFVPLIADPKGIDKMSLYKELKPNEDSLFFGTDDNYEDHLPIFTVVMKQVGLSRQLECHGFICASEEDAIVIAANLYSALVQAMPNVLLSAHTQDDVHKLKQENGISSIQRAEFSANVSELCTTPMTKTSITPLKGNSAPTRPPRKIKSHNGIVMNGNMSDSKYNNRKETFDKITSDTNLKNIVTARSETDTNKDVINVQSNYSCSIKSEKFKDNPYQIYSTIHPAPDHQDVGDILTKVAIPRSKSFLNASGPFSSRYTTTLNGIGNNSKGNCRKSSIGSPLGLNELFQEFRHQEGLYNVDEILNAIIDSDGMSFNDLKPIYKEFVLKLALTLTKDELYQRSKSIMQKQKNKRQQIKRRNSCKLRRSLTTGSGLKKAFKRSVCNFKKSKQRSNSFELTSVLFPTCGNKLMQRAHTKFNCKKVWETSSVSDVEVSKCIRKDTKGISVLKVKIPHETNSRSVKLGQESFSKNKQKTKSDEVSSSAVKLCAHADAVEDRDPPTEKFIGKDVCINPTSSGYFTCSECSYDSETCTCISAEKCYCSLGKKRLNTLGGNNGEVSLSICGCDTDSCLESEKCYCNQPEKLSIFEQLKQQGFAASESSVSRSESSATGWNKKHTDVHIAAALHSKQNKSGLKSSKSLEFLQIQRPKITHKCHCDGQKRSKEKLSSTIQIYEQLQKKESPLLVDKNNPNEVSNSLQRRSYSSDNLALDYEMFNHNGNKIDEEEEKEKKILVVSTRDPSGNLIYVGASSRAFRKLKKAQSDLENVTYSVANEALSVKKSAEIAALFSQFKIEKDEVIYNTLEPPDYIKIKQLKGGYRDSNLENSLGYFP